MSDYGSLRLALPEPAHVAIELRNLMGRTLLHLKRERMEIGDHLIPIDVTNLPAAPIPSSSISMNAPYPER